MGLEMHHGEVDSQKNSSVSFYIELIQAMEQMSSSIDNFSNATLLKGTAYDSAKSYFSQTHKNLAQGFVYLAEEMIRQVEEFPSGFKSSVSGSDVIEDQLNDQLNRLRSLAAGAEALSKALPLMNPLVSLYEAMEKSIQEKITKLHDYNQTSSSSFETAIQMIDNLTNGLADIGSDKGWDSSSGSFNLTGLKMDWVQPIKDIESKKREKEQKEPDTTGRKYIFLEIAPGVRIWVWSSDGRTANQADLIFTERHNAWKVKYAIEQEKDPEIEQLIMENYAKHLKRVQTGKDENGRELTTLEKIQSGSVILSGIATLGSIAYWGNKVTVPKTSKTKPNNKPGSKSNNSKPKSNGSKPNNPQVKEPKPSGGKSKGATKIINKDGSIEIVGEGAISEVIDNRPYLDPKSRPSFRKGVPEKVFENAKGPDGLVRDPLHPDKVIDWEPGNPRKDIWDMGHLPDQKYSDMHKRYVNGELTPAEFRDWFNDPLNYRPELPSTNRGHQLEK